MSCALVQVYMQIFAGGWLKQTSSGRACHINVLKLQAGLHHNPATKACCLQLSHLASGPMLYFDPQNGVTLCPQLHAHTRLSPKEVQGHLAADFQPGNICAVYKLD